MYTFSISPSSAHLVGKGDERHMRPTVSEFAAAGAREAADHTTRAPYDTPGMAESSQ